MKRVLVLPLLLTACKPAVETAVDMQPVGEGLRFLGFCIVLAVLLVLIGLFIMKGGDK
jgi:hypothetical protein